MVKVIAHNYFKEANQAKALKIVEQLALETRKEDGCIEYDFYQDATDKSHFVFIENWESAEALDIHCNTPHFKKAVPALGELASKEGHVEKFVKLI